MAYVLPTGHNDPDSKWTSEASAYDNNVETWAKHALQATGYWTAFLELTRAATNCDKVRFYNNQNPGGNLQLDIDVYYGGAWNHVFSGNFANATYVEKALGAIYSVTALRVRLYNGTGSNQELTLSEAHFNEVVAPTVTTQNCTDITGQTATGNGNITATGGVNATRRGFCYKVGTSGDPTIADSVVYDDGSFGTGAYTKGITGLSPTTGYRVRAYAVNSIGTGYGATVQLTTASPPTVTTQEVTEILSTTATGNGNITATGGLNATKRGVCWNTTGSPTVADSKSEETGSFGTGAFTRPMTGLLPGTLYYVKAYAYNSAGYGYGAEVNFTTDKVAPTVTVQSPTNISTTSVTANGNITALGGENATVRGFKYGLTQTNTWSASDSGSFSAGAYTKGLVDLSPNTTYWIRAYATNSIGTSYSSWIQFQTSATGTIPMGTKISICSDYSGYTYQLNKSFTDDGESYESFFVLSTDLANKQGLHINKRLEDIFSYFTKKESGTAKIYIKQDNEAEWNYAGEISMVGDEDIVVPHLPIDFLAKSFLIKFVFTNDFEYIGSIFESIPIGVR